MISRKELVEPDRSIAALTPRQVGGKVFDMNLHTGPVGGEQVERDGPFLPDQSRLVAVGRQR